MSDLYAVLGISKDASDAEIQVAYKRKAMLTHPDREGGSPELFQEVALAYKVLSDPDSRKNYDETGSTIDMTSIHDYAINNLKNLFMQLVEQSQSGFEVDILEKMVQQINHTNALSKGTLGQLQRGIAHLEKVMKRIQTKSGKDNVFYAALLMSRAQKEAQIETIETQDRIGARMLVLLEDYSWVPEDKPIDHGYVFDNLYSGSSPFTSTSSAA